MNRTPYRMSICFRVSFQLGNAQLQDFRCSFSRFGNPNHVLSSPSFSANFFSLNLNFSFSFNFCFCPFLFFFCFHPVPPLPSFSFLLSIFYFYTTHGDYDRVDPGLKPLTISRNGASGSHPIQTKGLSVAAILLRPLPLVGRCLDLTILVAQQCGLFDSWSLSLPTILHPGRSIQ